jgi:hypothetical protein
MATRDCFLSGKPASLGLVLLGLLCASAVAQVPGRIELEPPGDRDFVLDKADLLTPADEDKIRQLADQLLTDKAVPIIVVTIESMAAHGGEGLRIETFARLLFDQWEIGPATDGIAASCYWSPGTTGRQGSNSARDGSATTTPRRSASWTNKSSHGFEVATSREGLWRACKDSIEWPAICNSPRVLVPPGITSWC